MTYASVCSGIEAASVAWEPLGWRPAWFSEIEPFPSAVLAHRFPDVPNLGDMTKIRGDEHGTVDLLVGGTPCQDLSVAGKRMGFGGKRSVLAIDFVRLAYECRAKWFAWENVPGVFSSNGGEDFAQLLSLFAGWQVDVPADGWGSFGIVEHSPGCFGLAWRVIDVQYARVDGFPNAIPQRRNRVFIIGYLGDWRRAAQVLFEPEGLLGNTPPRRESGKGTAEGAERSVAHSLRAQSQCSFREDTETIVFDARGNGDGVTCVAFGWNKSAAQSLRVDDQKTDALQASPSSNPAIACDFLVRRLTPIECERLMGFPTVRKTIKLEFERLQSNKFNVIISAENGGLTWLENQKKNVDVGDQNHKLLKHVGSAEKTNAPEHVGFVGKNLNTEHPQTEKHALLNVLIFSEENHTQIITTQRSQLNANVVEKRIAYLPFTQHEDFVLIIAGINSILEKITRCGREESRRREEFLTGQEAGVESVKMYGLEIMQPAKDAEIGLTTHKEHLKSITSSLLNSKNTEHDLTTLFLYALNVITGYIPIETIMESSLTLTLISEEGWTRIPWRGKPAEDCPDGPRYKACGNSMGVNVMRWIGTRIQELEESK